jgi:cytidylate kinase
MKETMKRVIVAIDGPAGAGKSTIARRVAARLGYLYLDTGAMYRAVALWARRTNVALDDMHRLGQLAVESVIHLDGDRVFLNGEDVTTAIREPRVSEAASQVSAVPAVRRALVEKQRAMAAETSVVMEGRDIGTVVFPEAAVKVFLDADAAVRAQRRHSELGDADRDGVAREMADRDQRDRSRTDAPLVQAPDAVYVDSTGLSIDQVEEAVLKIVRDRTSNGKEVAR